MPNSLISFFKQYRYECICFVLLFVMALIGFSTHEPLYDESQTYANNFFPSLEGAQEIFDRWTNADVPTVLIGDVPLDFLYDNPAVLTQYWTAYAGEINELWKLNPPKKYPLPIYFFYTLWDKYKDQILAEAAADSGKF